MRLLEVVVRTPLSDALGWTLFHSLWEGIVIAAVFAALMALVRSPRIRYLAGCFALLTMVGSFVITLLLFLPDTNDGAKTLIGTQFAPWKGLAGSNGSAERFPDLVTFIPWLGPLWLLGVCIFYLRSAAGWLSLYKLRRRGVCPAADSWQLRLACLAAELKVSRPVVLLESLLADTPLVMGHFRPVVLVPLGFLAGLPPDQVEIILLHELAHISRSDFLLNVCQRLVEGLLFYHPAVWWISKVLRVERENCCDDKVVALRGDAYGYAMALTALEHNRLEQQWPAHEPALAATGGNLMKRVKRLLYPGGSGGIWTPVLAAVILLAGAALTLAAWHVNPHPGATSKQVDQKAGDPWQRWLNEDVVYIILEEEKEAFERLTTDEERQQFVEQFWERRNPSPGSAANEFKQEYYRRVAYANQHYAVGEPINKAGWQTARGRIYILFGPPDEIDSHPIGDPTGVPFEDWLYLHLAHSDQPTPFHFVDPGRTQEYELVTGATHGS